jgi:hypothetical protein
MLIRAQSFFFVDNESCLRCFYCQNEAPVLLAFIEEAHDCSYCIQIPIVALVILLFS